MDWQALRLIYVTVLLILITSAISYFIKKRQYEEKYHRPMPFSVFINGVDQLPSWKTIMGGMLYGLVFGFLDNFFIYFGIDSLQKYMPGGTLTKAGLGNTYSDFVGAVVGAHIGFIYQTLSNISQDAVPIWVNSIAIVIGCLLGLYIPILITGQT